MTKSACLTIALAMGSCSGFAFTRGTVATSKTQLYMGLFDGVKDAFSTPALERSTLDAERETPIDRWFGWSVAKDDTGPEQQGMIIFFISTLYHVYFFSLSPLLYNIAVSPDFVDSMDPVNYVAVELEKPMGIVFEENEDGFGGIFVQSLKEGCKAEGLLKEGDQLVAVGTKKVTSLIFDDALGAIIDDSSEKTKLLVFRGSAKQLYGPTGASNEWLDEFVAKGGVEA
jgi:hypothetical protein